jgi:hypothetical protein
MTEGARGGVTRPVVAPTRRAGQPSATRPASVRSRPPGPRPRAAEPPRPRNDSSQQGCARQRRAGRASRRRPCARSATSYGPPRPTFAVVPADRRGDDSLGLYRRPTGEDHRMCSHLIATSRHLPWVSKSHRVASGRHDQRIRPTAHRRRGRRLLAGAPTNLAAVAPAQPRSPLHEGRPPHPVPDGRPSGVPPRAGAGQTYDP